MEIIDSDVMDRVLVISIDSDYKNILLAMC